MYQAPNPDDAEKILEANLETLTSRSARYAGKQYMTVDVTGLFGISAWKTNGVDDFFKPGGRMGNVYVPLGLQLGTKLLPCAEGHWLGLLLYPFDLGSYVKQEDAAIRFQDAFRVGAALYARLAVPLTIGVGWDAKANDPNNCRLMGFAAVEVPIFGLN